MLLEKLSLVKSRADREAVKWIISVIPGKLNSALKEKHYDMVIKNISGKSISSLK